MVGRTRDWLKLISLASIAFVFGLVFASALDFPRSGVAAATSALQAPGARLRVPAAEPAADLGEAFTAVADHVKPAVVYIRAERRAPTTSLRLPPGFEDFFRFPTPRRPPIQEGNGSGFIVSPDGYILTNHHVVQGVDRLTVRLYDKRELDARVVGSDANTDVAVIKIDAKDLPTAALGNSDQTRIGEWVLAIGNPLGEAFAFTVTAGIVSAKGRGLAGLRGENTYTIHDFIQTDAAINPGNSGGPLVNIRGEVVGINSAIASETGFYAGYGFAVPINLAREVMEQLIATGRVRRAVLGVGIDDATQLDAEAVGLREIKGVAVKSYSSEDSPAQRGGIRLGDVIVAVDGKPIESVPQLQQMIGFKKPGESVAITVVRGGGQRRTVTVQLGEAPSGDDARVAGRDTRRDAPGRGQREEALGIAVEPMSRDDARNQRLTGVAEAGGGMLVTEVVPDGPAYRRLVAPEDGPDVILSVNDQPVRSRAELREALKDVKAGDVVTLSVYNPRAPGRERIVRLRAQ
jgi:serine protease Do